MHVFFFLKRVAILNLHFTNNMQAKFGPLKKKKKKEPRGTDTAAK